ncbi:MAG TPA: PEP-CTERM sorting domain-containing protein [Tepidisphaeraceae bacterium]|nr:PEP-CTERM sorting domain-containing protein [Tepidisphaeraceae bacterium]
MNFYRGGSLKVAAAVAALIFPTLTKAAAITYYWSGDQASAGTVSSPIAGSWSSGSTANWFQDAAGTTTDGVGVNPASSSSTQIYFGGDPGHNAYKVSGNSGITINNIVLQDNAAVTDTLDFTLTGSAKVSLAAPGTMGAPAVGFQQTGSANWSITDSGGATAPLRFSNSASVTGNGSGNVTFSAPMASNGTPVNFTVNESGGATVAFTVSNSNMVGTAKTWTIQNGIVDFQNSTAFGGTAYIVSLSGGTVESTTGTTLSTYTGGITLAGNVAFAGPVNWSLGSSAVAVAATRTIVANTGGTTGTTIAGAITGAGGITIDGASTGKLTVTNAGDNYAGPTTITGGTLVDNGNISASAVSVGAAGTLAGNGIVGLTSSAVSISGALAPGGLPTVPGTISLLGGAAFSGSSAAYDVDLNSAGLADSLTTTNLDLGTATVLNLNVLDATSGAPYTIATYTGTLTGTFSLINNLPAGYAIDYGTGSNSTITLDLATTPEPASLSMLGIGCVAMMRRRKVSK